VGTMRCLFSVRRLAALAAATGAAVIMVPLSSMPLSASARPLAAAAISIKSVFVTNGSGKSASSFKNGDAIEYHIVANNSSSRILKITVAYFTSVIVSRGSTRNEYIIASKSVSAKLPPGVSKFHSMSRIPLGATAAAGYTLEGVVFEDSDRSDSDTVFSSNFTVKHAGGYPLSVPYFSQFAESPKNNECGETSVAMAAAYYVDLYDTPKEWIAAVRDQIGITRGADTNANQLAKALWGTGEMQIKIKSISSKTPVATAVSDIKRATEAGYPVIAFIDASKLTRPRPYTGHWIVITGISGKYVYVNDPDNLRPPQGTGQSKTTKWPLDEYEAAAESGVASQGQPYGLIVRGEYFQSG
jgi:uncharacterized protein YvpB